MNKKKTNTEESAFDSVEQALSKTEQFIEDNKNTLLTVVAVVIAIIGGYVGAKKAYFEPRADEAAAEMYVAERYFAQDSFLLALDGDGQYAGFLEIIDNYGGTPAANLAQYYTGISFLKTGEYDDAIKHLSKFKSNDRLVSAIATGAIGDAYSELEEFGKAASQYEKAAKMNPNDLTSAFYLKKAGLVYEAMEEYSKAVTAYETIKVEYPNAEEARDIEKYIAAAKVRS